DFGVFSPQSTISALKRVAALNEEPRHLANAIGMAVGRYLLRLDSRHGTSLKEELFNRLWHEAPLLRLDRLTHDWGEIELFLSEALKCGLSDSPEPAGINLFDNPISDIMLVKSPCVHVPKQALKEICGHDLADNIEDLVGA